MTKLLITDNPLDDAAHVISRLHASLLHTARTNHINSPHHKGAMSNCPKCEPVIDVLDDATTMCEHLLSLSKE